MRGRVLALFVVMAPMIVLADACREPTQVTLEIRTEPPCRELGGVAIAVASVPATAEERGATFPDTATTQCDSPSTVGTLVVTPSADAAAIVVLAAVGGKKVSECKPGSYDRCIVARRRFSFIEHVSLTVPIDLTTDCVGIPCEALSTCKKGLCVDSALDCDETGCADLGTTKDGGAAEGAVPDVVFDDRAGPDAGGDVVVVDAAHDVQDDRESGTTDGGPPPACGAVNCPVAPCANGTVCCAVSGKALQCVPPGQCNAIPLPEDGGAKAEAFYVCCRPDQPNTACGAGTKCCSNQADRSFSCNPAFMCPTAAHVLCGNGNDCVPSRMTCMTSVTFVGLTECHPP
jgi:hypothetical protein